MPSSSISEFAYTPFPFILSASHSPLQQDWSVQVQVPSPCLFPFQNSPSYMSPLANMQTPKLSKKYPPHFSFLLTINLSTYRLLPFLTFRVLTQDHFSIIHRKDLRWRIHKFHDQSAHHFSMNLRIDHHQHIKSHHTRVFYHLAIIPYTFLQNDNDKLLFHVFYHLGNFLSIYLCQDKQSSLYYKLCHQPTLHHKLRRSYIQELLYHFSYFLSNLRYTCPHFCSSKHLSHVFIHQANFPHISLRQDMYKYQSHFCDPCAITHHKLLLIYMYKHLSHASYRLGICLDISLHWNKCKGLLRRIYPLSIHPYICLCWGKSRCLYHFYNLDIVQYILLRQDSLFSDTLGVGFPLNRRIERGIIISTKGDESAMGHDYFDEMKQPSCLNSIYQQSLYYFV